MSMHDRKSVSQQKIKTIMMRQFFSFSQSGTFAILTFAALAALAVNANSERAEAQVTDTYPSRLITLVVPFPAGGTLDIVGRIAATQISKTLGQQVVVENRAGAG